MPSVTNNLQLSIEVDSSGAIKSVQAVNQAFTSMGNNAANAGNNASNAFDKITVRMAAATTAGSLLAGVIQRIGQWMKEATIDAALYAAKVDQLQMGLNAVVRANDGNTAVANAQVAAIRAMGVTTEDATLAVTKLTAAGADYTKTAALMKVALMLVHDFGLSTTQAIDGLSRAVTTGYERTLRQYGLNIDFAKSYQKLAAETGRTVDQLGEMEKLQARHNAVVDYGTHLNDNFAKKQVDVAEAIRVTVVDLKQLSLAFGETLQTPLRATLGMFDAMVQSLTNLIHRVDEAKPALRALIDDALTTNSAKQTGLDLLLGIGLQVGIMGGAKAAPAIADQRAKEAAEKAASDAESKRITLVQKQRDDEERAAAAAVAAAKKLAAERQRVEEDADRTLTEIGKEAWNKYYHEVDSVFQKMADAMQKHALTVKAHVEYIRALLGPNGMIATAQKSEMADYLKSSGYLESKHPFSAADEMAIKADKDLNNYETEVLKNGIDAIGKRYDYEEQRLSESKDMQLRVLDSVNAQTVKQKLAVEQQKYAIEVDYLERSKQLQLSRLAGEAQVQLGEAGSRFDVAISSAGDDQAAQIRANSIYAQDQSTINSNLSVAQQAVTSQTSSQEQEAADSATKAQTKVIQDKYKSVYDAILQASDKFFDSLTDKSKSVWKSIADDLENTFKNALKRLISSQIAGAFAQMITGIGPNGEGGKAGGRIMGGIPGMGGGGFASAGFGLAAAMAGSPGGTPTFLPSGGGGSFFGPALPGGTAAIGSIPGVNMAAISNGGGGFGGGGVSADAASAAFGGGVLPAAGMMLHGPGGTPGFFPGPIGGTGSAGTSFGGASNPLSGLGKIFSGGLSKSGLMSMVNPALMMAGSAMFMRGAFSPSTAGTASGTANTIAGLGMAGYGYGGLDVGLGGAGLGMLINGSERGTPGGMLESTAGGALAGSELLSFLPGIGTVAGGLIGGAVGAISGLIGMFVGNATDHVKDVVRKSYGLKIDTTTAQAILKIAQQQFGGSISLAVSSASVRSMLAMYAASTGQGNGNQISPKMSGYTVADLGGQGVNLPSTIDAQSTGAYGGILPSAPVGATASAGLGMASGSNVVLQLDGAATTSLLSGVATSVAPGAVANSYQSNSGRLGTYATFAQPGLVTR